GLVHRPPLYATLLSVSPGERQQCCASVRRGPVKVRSPPTCPCPPSQSRQGQVSLRYLLAALHLLRLPAIEPRPQGSLRPAERMLDLGLLLDQCPSSAHGASPRMPTPCP